MAEWIISIGDGLGLIGMAVVLVLGSYLVARRLLHPGFETDRTHDVASNVATRIAALHGLILALVYAQELDDYKGLRNVLVQEAVAVADVWHDAGRYGGALQGAIQADMADYVRIVVDDEWRLLGDHGGLSGDAWVKWDAAYETVLDLTPATPRETFLQGRMLERVTAISGYRQQREAVANRTFAVLFWTPALVGLALLAVPMYLYRPSRSHIVLIALFGAYSGVILFFIYAFANPFQEPGRLEPLPFIHLLEGDIGRTPSG